MKKITYLLMILSAVYFSACDGMDDLHKEFIVPGGIIYPQKADSLKVFEGRNRVRVQWLRNTDPKVVKARIYWNNYTDSVNVDIPSSGSIVSVDINNIPEETYTFAVKTFDAEGNVSVPTEVIGKVYGALYESSISPRNLSKMEAYADRVELNWGVANSTAIRFVLKYRTSSGELRELLVPLDEEKTILTDYKVGGDFSTETYYLPTSTALDEFVVTDTQSFPDVFLADKSQFSVVACSSESESDNSLARYILDNDLNTFWQSKWSGGAANPPHWLVIDLGASLDIAKVEIARRAANADTKTVQISIGDDPNSNATTWRELGVLLYPNDAAVNSKALEIEPETNTDGRYLKLYLPDSNRNPYVGIAEIYIYVR
jgi:hypothetical protein